MHVALLTDRIPPENRGGAGEVVWRLAQGLHAAGHQVTLICATPDAPFTAIRAGLRTIHLHSRYPQRWRAWLSLYNPQTVEALRAVLHDIRPDVVNAHNIHSDLSYHSLTLAQQLGLRTVFSSHDVMPFAYTKLSHFVRPDTCDIPDGGYRLPWGFNLRQNRLRYNPFRNLVIRRVLARCDARTAVSAALARAHAENGLPPFTVVHNGIDVRQWQPPLAAIRALAEQPDLKGRRIILFGGRLSAAKGTQPLLAALQQVITQVPAALLLVASAQPIEDQLTPAQLAPLRGHIRSAGWLAGDTLAAAYQVAQVVVTPSIIFDSLPTMNLEAMACAKPVITTCFGGASEAVLDGVTGYVLNPFDTDALAQRLTQVLTDEALAQRLGEAGAQRVQQHFSLAQYVAQMVAIYEGR